MSEPILVEVGQYKPINKGFLVGTFSLYIVEPGIKILNCSLFSKNGNDWVSFPSICIKKENQPNSYIPYITFSVREYKDRLTAAVLLALQPYIVGQTHGQANNPEDSTCDLLQDDSPLVW